MPDYNPDREGHVKHRFIVQPNSKFPHQKGVKLDNGKFLKFNREKRFTTSNEPLARELQEEYRKDLVVTRVRHPDEADRGHNFFFGSMPGVPYAKYDELGRRIKDNENLPD